MTALTQDRDTRRKRGELGSGPIAASKMLHGGAALCFNSSGYLTPGDDAAGLIFAGICTNPMNNLTGANGDLTAVFERVGLHLMLLATAAAITDTGKKVFLVDDQTVDLEANVSHNIPCGVLAELVTSTLAYIDIAPAVMQTDIFVTPTLITDPGDAGAIPVGLSGNCAITTAAAETRTLAAPERAGLKLAISMDVDGGNCVITAAAAINQAGNNTITMADAGDALFLEAVQVGGANVWHTIGNDGCALSTV